MPRVLRVCAQPGCPTLTASRRCPDHQRKTEQARGSRQQRGYDAEHDRIRTALLARFQPGTLCPKCGQPMLNGQKLDAGHSVDLRDDPNAKADQLEHAGCNRGWRRGQ
jgi:hypothetical protein